MALLLALFARLISFPSTGAWFALDFYLNNSVSVEELSAESCPRNWMCRTNLLVLKTSYFQGANIRPTTPRYKHSFAFFVHH